MINDEVMSQKKKEVVLLLLQEQHNSVRPKFLANSYHK